MLAPGKRNEERDLDPYTVPYRVVRTLILLAADTYLRLPWARMPRVFMNDPGVLRGVHFVSSTLRLRVGISCMPNLTQSGPGELPL
jgi:hypothetical protein